MRNYFISTLLLLTLLTSFSLAAAGIPSMTVGTFPQEVRREFTVAEGSRSMPSRPSPCWTARAPWLVPLTD